MLLPFAIVMIRAGLDGHCEVGQKSQMATNRNNTIDYDNRPRTPNVTSWQAVMCDQWLSTPLRVMNWSDDLHDLHTQLLSTESVDSQK